MAVLRPAVMTGMIVVTIAEMIGRGGMTAATIVAVEVAPEAVPEDVRARLVEVAVAVEAATIEEDAENARAPVGEVVAVLGTVPEIGEVAVVAAEIVAVTADECTIASKSASVSLSSFRASRPSSHCIAAR